MIHKNSQHFFFVVFIVDVFKIWENWECIWHNLKSEVPLTRKESDVYFFDHFDAM